MTEGGKPQRLFPADEDRQVIHIVDKGLRFERMVNNWLFISRTDRKNLYRAVLSQGWCSMATFRFPPNVSTSVLRERSASTGFRSGDISWGL